MDIILNNVPRQECPICTGTHNTVIMPLKQCECGGLFKSRSHSFAVIQTPGPLRHCPYCDRSEIHAQDYDVRSLVPIERSIYRDYVEAFKEHKMMIESNIHSDAIQNLYSMNRIQTTN